MTKVVYFERLLNVCIQKYFIVAGDHVMKKQLAFLMLTLILIFSGFVQVMAENDPVESSSNAIENQKNEGRLEIKNSPPSDPINVVKIGSTEYTSLKDAVKAAHEGDTITVIVKELRLTEYTNIPGTKKLTLDLNHNKIIFAADKPTYHNINIDAGGYFTIKNGTITAEDIDKDTRTSAGISVTNSDLYMDHIEAYGMKSYANGGVLDIDNNEHDPTVEITNSKFHDNEAARCGGAINISNSNLGGFYGKYSILGCDFENNLAFDNAGSYGAAFGGAICISSTGTILIKGNNISNNEARADNIYGSWANFKWSCGGGMYISSNVNAPAKANVTLEGNTISSNKAQFMGGGVYLELTKSSPKNDEIHINSGLFSYNTSEYAGGGLDYSAHNQPLLKMENAIITGNESYSGAGVWACPTSRVRTHSTLGAAIIGNKLIKTPDEKIYPFSGNDIRFEGSDTKIGGISDNNNPAKNTMTVQDRTFVGSKVNWYADDPENPYKPENPILTPDQYTNRSTSFGLHGEIVADKDWYEKHEKEAKIFFIGNKATKRGGAISTNSEIDFGQPNDVDLKVSKKWLNNDGSELKKNLPKFVKVKLVRKDAKGGSFDLETVKLNADNQWTYKFENLPSKGYVNGEVTEFSYEVVEVSKIKGFKCEIKKIKSKDKIGYEYSIENTKEKPEEHVKTGDSTPIKGLTIGTSILVGMLYIVTRRIKKLGM